MSVTRPCFTTQHHTCKTKTTACKTKTDFFGSQTGLVPRLTVSGHITAIGLTAVLWGHYWLSPDIGSIFLFCYFNLWLFVLLVSFKIIMTTSERNKTVFHNTTSHLQDQDHSVQDQDQDWFFRVSDRSCPKTDSLRSHHCYRLNCSSVGSLLA